MSACPSSSPVPGVRPQAAFATPVPRPTQGTQSAGARSAAGPGAVDSRSLLCGAREVLIRHRGETYRLRHTRNDKLILTK